MIERQRNDMHHVATGKEQWWDTEKNGTLPIFASLTPHANESALCYNLLIPSHSAAVSSERRLPVCHGTQ